MKWLTVVLLCLLLAQVVHAQAIGTSDVSSNGPNPVAVSVRSEPSPVAPGEYVDIWLTIENRGNRRADDVTVRALLDYPYSIDQEEKTVVVIGSLEAFQRSQAKFTVRVAGNALEGTYPMNFEIRNSASVNRVPVSVNIDVRPLDHLVTFENIRVSPSPVPQGSEFTITGELHNRGSTPLRSIRLGLTLPTSNLFVPIGESNEQVVSYLAGNEAKQVTFRLVTDPAAASGPVILPLGITFFKTTGEQINQTQNLGVVVGSAPTLSVLLDSTTLTKDSKTGTIVLKFVNRGLEDVKFLNAKIANTDQYTLLSAQEYYLGKVDSDDFETVEVSLRPASTGLETLTVPVTLEFSDGNNNKYTEKHDVTVRLFTASELGTSSGSIVLPIVVVLVILGVGYYFWRRRKARKNK